MNKNETSTITLMVGGLDPTGGAGILLDVVASRAAGTHGAAVLAVNTIQDGARFQTSHPETPGSIRAAMIAVLKSARVGAVKTGALASAENVEAIADLAKESSFPPLVIDPVVRSSSGGALLDDAGVTALKTRLLPESTLITPNLAEASVLTGVEVRNIDEMQHAGEKLLEMGARAALVKGGHLEGNETADVLVSAKGSRVFSAKRIPGPEIRGTGCALASLIAGFVARDYDLTDAVTDARHVLRRAIEGAHTIGPGPRVLDFSANTRDTGIA